MAMKIACRLEFDIDNIDRLLPGERTELRAFIKEALESWGRQRRPEDWLFDGLERVVVGAFRLEAKS